MKRCASALMCFISFWKHWSKEVQTFYEIKFSSYKNIVFPNEMSHTCAHHFGTHKYFHYSQNEHVIEINCIYLVREKEAELRLNLSSKIYFFLGNETQCFLDSSKLAKFRQSQCQTGQQLHLQRKNLPQDPFLARCAPLICPMYDWYVGKHYAIKEGYRISK